MAESDKNTPREINARDEARTLPIHGTVYGGRYSVEQELGRDGTGRILRARDVKIGRAVAVKILAADKHDDQQRRRFEQEARAAGALNDPNIVAVYDVGEHEGEPYIVSELLEGETLGSTLQNGRLVTEEVVELAIQLASGLAAAHRKGIVHLDLKPENLFLTDDGRLKILDFGVAKLLSKGSNEGTGRPGSDSGGIATPAYISPEQVRGEPADARSDVFACGAVLYEMLSGKPAFARGNAVETGFAILNEMPSPLSPGPLSPIVERCLAKDCARRYANASDLLDELNALIRGERIAASRRLRHRVTIIAAAMLVSAVALALVARHILRSRPGKPDLPQLLVVFPFTVRGTSQDADLGEGMMDLLSTTLTSESVRAVDPNALLTLLKRDGWSADPEQGRKIASRLGAKRFVLGTVVEVGSRIRIHALLYDAERNNTAIRDAKAEGDTDKILDLVDSVSAQIRGDAIAPGRGRNEHHGGIAAVTTSSPTALAAYLVGLRDKRRMRLPEAIKSFEKSVALDPSFALAWYMLAQTAWEQSGAESSVAKESVGRAMELRTKLREPDQQRLDALNSLLSGR